MVRHAFAFVDQSGDSEERVKNDPEFHYVMEDIDRLRAKIDDNRISLNEDVRKKSCRTINCAKNCARKSVSRGIKKNSRIYRLTLDSVDKPNSN